MSAPSPEAVLVEIANGVARIRRLHAARDEAMGRDDWTAVRELTWSLESASAVLATLKTGKMPNEPAPRAALAEALRSANSDAVAVASLAGRVEVVRACAAAKLWLEGNRPTPWVRSGFDRLRWALCARVIMTAPRLPTMAGPDGGPDVECHTVHDVARAFGWGYLVEDA